MRWPPDSSALHLDRDSVLVWAFNLDDPPLPPDALAELLSPAEAARASRLVYPELGRRLRMGRGMLRTLIAAYAGMAPDSLSFVYGPQGKPSLPEIDPPLHFNMTDSDGLCLIAFTREGELGVDVERHKSDRAMLKIARRNYTSSENEHVLSLVEPALSEAFYRIWCRKEAYLKAIGTGLRFPLRRVEVLGDEVCVEEEGCWRSDGWHLFDLPPIPGYSGAICVRPKAPRLRTYRGMA